MVVVTYEGFFLRLVKSLRDPIIHVKQKIKAQWINELLNYTAGGDCGRGARRMGGPAARAAIAGATVVSE